jgi:uncharacterized protein (DUF2384 family)
MTSDSLSALADEYPGDAAWDAFSRAWGVPDGNVRAVADAVGGEAWLQNAVPVLDRRRPDDVLREHPDGQLVVRSVLMRMP